MDRLGWVKALDRPLTLHDNLQLGLLKGNLKIWGPGDLVERRWWKVSISGAETKAKLNLSHSPQKFPHISNVPGYGEVKHGQKRSTLGWIPESLITNPKIFAAVDLNMKYFVGAPVNKVESEIHSI